MSEGALFFYASLDCPACGDEVRCDSALAVIDVGDRDKPTIPLRMGENLAFHCEMCGEYFETGEVSIQ